MGGEKSGEWPRKTYVKDVTVTKGSGGKSDYSGIIRMAVANGGWSLSAIACAVVAGHAHSFGAVSIVLCIAAALFLFAAWRQSEDKGGGQIDPHPLIRSCGCFHLL